MGSFEVLEITTKRQFRGIDLLAEIKVQVGNTIQNFILNIENKWYTTIRENQLKNYVDVIQQHFDLTEKTLVNVFIFCDDTIVTKNLSQIELCQKYEYIFTHVGELALLAGIYKLGMTGNALFDEYWFNNKLPLTNVADAQLVFCNGV